MYINVGALVNGVRPKTKKALKDALATDPSSVQWDSTSDHGPVPFGCQVSGNALTAGTKLSVVGPCPTTKRSWYATVELKNGKVVVS